MVSDQDDDLRFRLSRRRLLAGAAGTGGALALGGSLWRVRGALGDAQTPAPKLRALTAGEAAVLGAMCDRIFPPDEDSPGATDIGVLHYLDSQLAGDFGSGTGSYRHGPFHEASTSGLGYQLDVPPRDAYKTALRRVDEHCRQTEGNGFAELPPARQDAILTAMENGKVDLGMAKGPNGYTSATFFTDLLLRVSEGLFSDPMYGGNRDVAGWRWVGYPGDPMAYGDAYWTIFGHPDDPYDVKPRGIKEGM